MGTALSASPLPSIPASVAKCPLLRADGFMVVALLSAADLARLQEEAKSQESLAQRNVCVSSTADEWRGGIPARAYALANGGSVQHAIHASAGIHQFLRQIIGVPATLSGGGSYSYYSESGDFLALHRDVLACDVALITCLEAAPASQDSGRLLLYPGHVREPLSAVRQAGAHAAVAIHLEPGESIVMLGGLVPHEVTAVTRRRLVSVACYRGW
jgi:hypothetical protein